MLHLSYCLQSKLIIVRLSQLAQFLAKVLTIVGAWFFTCFLYDPIQMVQRNVPVASYNYNYCISACKIIAANSHYPQGREIPLDIL